MWLLLWKYQEESKGTASHLNAFINFIMHNIVLCIQLSAPISIWVDNMVHASCYLQRHGVRQSPDGDGVQLSVGETPRFASQHFGVSAAVQLVSHLQRVFTWKHTSKDGGFHLRSHNKRKTGQSFRERFTSETSLSQKFFFLFSWKRPRRVA